MSVPASDDFVPSVHVGMLLCVVRAGAFGNQRMLCASQQQCLLAGALIAALAYMCWDLFASVLDRLKSGLRQVRLIKGVLLNHV